MKSRKFYICAASLILSMTACKKDYLETSPTDKVSQEEIFSTINNANTALSGIYRLMFERTTLIDWNVQNKPGVGGVMLAMDFMGDDLNMSSANWFTSTGEGNWDGHRIDVHRYNEYVYRTFYKIIGDSNYILDNVDNIEATDDQKNAVKSQALTLRAYAYSYLVQFYGKRHTGSGVNDQLGVPLVLNSLDGALPRSTVSEVYAQIVDDLTEAINIGTTSRTNKSIANQDVALGLRARVALTMHDYPAAIEYANRLITSGAFPLMDQAQYQQGFNDAPAMSEWIWASMPSSDQADAFGSYFAQIAYNANTSFMRGNPKRINSVLYDWIPATDVRKLMWEAEPDAENFPLPTTAFARQPYMSRKFSIKAPGNSWGDVPLMRLSEMQLILAEAYASSNQDGLAQDALFELTRVRDSEAVKSTNTGSALLQEIWNHRRVELWGEGFRFLDLKRLNQPLDRTVVPNFLPGTVNNVMSVPAGDDRWQFVFPRPELDANPLIEQND